MTSVRKLEIIVDALALDQVLAILEAHKVAGWTVVRDVEGRGERGDRADNELTGVFRNVWIMTACDPDVAARVTDALRPILTRLGGICLASDALYLTH